jgi:hypothetical protein
LRSSFAHRDGEKLKKQTLRFNSGTRGYNPVVNILEMGAYAFAHPFVEQRFEAGEKSASTMEKFVLSFMIRLGPSMIVEREIS